MGRFVTSENVIDYSYKFVVAEQPSNFGEVLKDAGLNYASVTRYISDDNDGEFVSLFVDNSEKLKDELTLLAQDFQERPEEEMIKMLVNALPNGLNCETIKFFVEY